MAFTPFNFTKSWRNAGDFPTFEPDEAKVRDDLQSLFDELKVGLNRLIGELKASNMPFTPTAEVDSSDVQNAIENVQSQIASAILGELPDGSVTARKLSDSAVETDKIEDGAVTAEKIAAGVLPEEAENAPLMDGEASVGESGAFAREDHVHPKDSTKADLIGGKVAPAQISRSRVNVLSSRSLALTDDNKALYVSSGTDVTLTIPANSSVQFPVGCEITVYRASAGGVIFAAAEGVTLYCSDPLNALKRYDTARLKKWDSNVWAVEINHTVAAGGITDNELADGSVVTGKIYDGAVTAAKLSSGAIPFKASVTIDNSWVGSESPYTHAVSVSGYTLTANSKVDIQPDAEAIAQLLDDEVSALYIGNNNGTLTAYAVGEKPTASLTLQVTVEEVR